MRLIHDILVIGEQSGLTNLAHVEIPSVKVLSRPFRQMQDHGRCDSDQRDAISADERSHLLYNALRLFIITTIIVVVFFERGGNSDWHWP